MEASEMLYLFAVVGAFAAFAVALAFASRS